MSFATTPRSQNSPVQLSPLNLGDSFDKLFERWGPQGWWPGDTQLEVVAGALLAQATSWKNAAGAVANLKVKGLLEDSAESLRSALALPVSELEELIRSSGYFRQKAQRLRRLLTFLFDNLGAPPWSIGKSHLQHWRERLLNINGLGPETVDSILLYGFDLPVFVVDAYTRRMLLRHFMIEERASYDMIQKKFEDLAFGEELNTRSAIYNEYHALIVRLGKEHCRRSPGCTGCPLNT